MLMKVLSNKGYLSESNMEEFETSFKIGDEFQMEYDWCIKIQCMNGFRTQWHKGIAEFKVVDMVLNKLINPNEVWLRLSSDDEMFRKRCGSKEFDAPEELVLRRKIA